jgi:hypothetical protein
MALPTEFYQKVESTAKALPSWKGELVSFHIIKRAFNVVMKPSLFVVF